MKKIIAFCLIFMLVSCYRGNVIASAYSVNEEVPLSLYREDNLQIAPIKADKVPRQYSELESSYLSPYITSVKNQNPYGTCWAFSCIAAAEASMIQEGLASKDNIDLSEWHLTYFLANSVPDSLGLTTGDCFVITNGDYLEGGGNQQLATYRMANWYGLVEEEVAPYETVVSNKKAVLSDEAAYSEDIAHLENAYWISMQDRDSVKQLIKQYGACATSYLNQDTYYSTGSKATWNANTEMAVYCPTALDTNHGITIVGWNDNYSRDNFGKYKPQSDGAWYCKNSWGSTWSKDGYFWISYEDVPLSNEEVFFYDYGSADNYDHNYQYDGGAWGSYYTTQHYQANVYTAQGDEYLKAIGFYTDNSNYNCKIQIYKNCAEDNPMSGTLVAEMTANQIYAGFHTVELDDRIILYEGESFSVVVYQETVDGEAPRISVDSNYLNQASWCKNVVATQTGQSFMSTKGENWYDMSDYQANCRIKAYTDTIPEEDKIKVSTINLSVEELTLYMQESSKLSATILPNNVLDKTIEWSSANNDIAIVNDDGTVTAKGVGETEIYCKAKDGSGIQGICKVAVKHKITEVNLNYASSVLCAGETLQLNATVMPEDATDKRVIWSSSDDSIATVDSTGKITGVGYGTAVITCIAVGRKDCFAVCEISVYEKLDVITFEQMNVKMYAGQRVQLKTITDPVLDKTMGVYWVSSNENVATVDENGVLTAVAPGTDVEIKCISKDGSGVEATCEVVVNHKITEVDLDYASGVLYAGETLQLNAMVMPEDAIDKSVIWSSSDDNIATVDSSGKITGVGYGTAAITCMADGQSECFAACRISVYEKLETITFNQINVWMYAGQRVQLQTVTSPVLDRTMGVYWISSDENVVTVDENGFLTAVAPGENVEIRCISKDGSGIKATCNVSVAPLITEITLQQESLMLEQGQLSKINVCIQPVNATVQRLVWSSSNNKVATVDANGVVTAIGMGNATIICEAGDGSGVKAACMVVVEENAKVYDKGKELKDPETTAVYKVTKGGKSDATVRFEKGNECIGTVTIPSTVKLDGLTYKVTSIAPNAFKNNRKITKVIIGSNIISVGKNAFSGCNKLASVTIGKNVTLIGSKAFYKCGKLTRITLPAKVNKIGKQAFYNCKKLKNITIKTSRLTSNKVGKQAFKGIYHEAMIKVPKKKLKMYKKLLVAKGAGNRVTVKKQNK